MEGDKDYCYLWHLRKNRGINDENYCEFIKEKKAKEWCLREINNKNKMSHDMLVYPKYFILRSTEIPSGFELKIIDEEAEQLGLKTNPGFLDDPAFFEQLYDNSDPSTIDQLFISIYVKPDNPSAELGVFAIHYKSEASLLKEIDKLKADKEIKCLMKNDYLVIIWSDTNDYETEMNEISDKLKERLDLQTITN